MYTVALIKGTETCGHAMTGKGTPPKQQLTLP